MRIWTDEELERMNKGTLHNKQSTPLTEEELKFVYRDSFYTQGSRRWNNTYRKAYGKED